MFRICVSFNCILLLLLTSFGILTFIQLVHNVRVMSHLIVTHKRRNQFLLFIYFFIAFFFLDQSLQYQEIKTAYWEKMRGGRDIQRSQRIGLYLSIYLIISSSNPFVIVFFLQSSKSKIFVIFTLLYLILNHMHNMFLFCFVFRATTETVFVPDKIMHSATSTSEWLFFV